MAAVVQMREWFEWEYFGDATLVRHQSVSTFLPISELFPLASGQVFDGQSWRQRLPRA